jgi:hypothetical protein
VLPDAADGFRAAVLPFASIAYPKDWYLLETSPDNAPETFQAVDVLQLTNWDTELQAVQCDVTGTTVPDHGVMLTIVLGNPDFDGPTWPVELQERSGSGERNHCSNTFLTADWSAPSGVEYAAVAHIGRDASPADLDALVRSFETLSFPEASDPQTEGFLGTPSLVLDSRETAVGPVALYAYEDDFEGGSSWIGVAGPAGTRLSGGAQIGREIPDADENVTMNLDSWGGVVWGTVPAVAQRAELRTVEGGTYPATLVPMPPALGVEGQQIVWGVLDVSTDDRVTTLLYDAEGRVLNTYFPTAPREVIASGTDQEGGPWELYLEHTDQGTGLGFAFDRGGGGGGCCLSPLTGHFRLDGAGSGTGEPSHITAFGSAALERVVFNPQSGDLVEGQVFVVPEERLGIAKVTVIIVPEDVPLRGTLLAFDGQGNEIGREFIGDEGEPVGPTPEIDAVWWSLRSARDASSQYFEREGSFAGLDARVLSELAPGITTATRPEPETVSVYVTDELHLVLSSTAITGESFCIAVEADGPEGGFNYRYGSMFAETYDECRGGWAAD